MRFKFLKNLPLQINISHKLEIVDYEHCQDETQFRFAGFQDLTT